MLFAECQVGARLTRPSLMYDMPVTSGTACKHLKLHMMQDIQDQRDRRRLPSKTGVTL